MPWPTWGCRALRRSSRQEREPVSVPLGQVDRAGAELAGPLQGKCVLACLGLVLQPEIVTLLVRGGSGMA
jgi:hypothetical protein